MTEIKFTAKQARELQLESDVTKRNENVENLRNEIMDENKNNKVLANILYDILLVAQTQMTRLVAAYIPNDNKYQSIVKKLEQTGYSIISHKDLEEKDGSIIIIGF